MRIIINHLHDGAEVITYLDNPDIEDFTDEAVTALLERSGYPDAVLVSYQLI